MEVCAWSENLDLTHANKIGVLPMTKEDLLKEFEKIPKIQKILSNKQIVRIIYVPNKIINLLLK